MKKIMVMGLAALSLAFLLDNPASAWVNCKFGVGLNWNWQSGGNNFLWGAFRNGQPPGPAVAYPGHYPAYPPAYGNYGAQQGFPGQFQHYGPYDFQYFGQHAPQNSNPGQGTQPAPSVPTNQQTPAAQPNVSWLANNYYQPVSYYRSAGYAGYYAPNYYQSYYYQPPYYWYSR